MRKILIVILALLALQPLEAAEKGKAPKVPPEHPHQVRIGWGDMLSETMLFPQASRDKGGKGYTGHLFAGYQYFVRSAFSVGCQLDFEAMGKADMTDYDLSVIPTIRFHYLNTDWVELHSGLGIGVLFAFDNKGGLEAAPVADINLIGVQLGQGPLRIGLDLGMMDSMLSSSKIYMLESRLVSISLNYTF